MAGAPPSCVSVVGLIGECLCKLGVNMEQLLVAPCDCKKLQYEKKRKIRFTYTIKLGNKSVCR